MSEQEAELSRRLHAARAARLTAQKTRLLALERAEKLERQLTHAAQSGLRSEISRSAGARSRLQAAAKRRSITRCAGIAALGLLLGAATFGIGLADSRRTTDAAESALQAPVLAAVPGDQLKLAYSYSVSLSNTR